MESPRLIFDLNMGVAMIFNPRYKIGTIGVHNPIHENRHQKTPKHVDVSIIYMTIQLL